MPPSRTTCRCHDGERMSSVPERLFETFWPAPVVPRIVRAEIVRAEVVQTEVTEGEVVTGEIVRD